MFDLVYLHATRDFAFDFNLLRFKPPMLCDAQDACQAALRAGEGSQGCVGSSRDAQWMHVPEGKAREAVGWELGEGCAGVFCAWWPGQPTALGARGPDSAVAYNSEKGYEYPCFRMLKLVLK